ncbi:MAG: transcription termination factor NusA [Bacilli bacterium]
MNGNELIKGINFISKEKGISEEKIFEYLEQALAVALKRQLKISSDVRVEVDRDTGEMKAFSFYTVIDDEVEEINFDTEIIHEEAVLTDPDIKVGDRLEERLNTENFGRLAASTAKQVLTGKIRDEIRTLIFEEYKDKIGELIIGNVMMEDNYNYYIELNKINAKLPKGELIPNEKIIIGSQIKSVIKYVNETTKGPEIILSRKSDDFVKRLIELEIPEFIDGIVYLYNIARIPGVRTKIAVYSNNPNVDPIGACIGERGSRISSIIKELSGEKIDIIRYVEENSEFIKNALSPAKDIQVIVTDEEERHCYAVCDQDNLSLAIGKKGSNVSLASRLTRFKIEIKTKEDMSELGINLL